MSKTPIQNLVVSGSLSLTGNADISGNLYFGNSYLSESELERIKNYTGEVGAKGPDGDQGPVGPAGPPGLNILSSVPDDFYTNRPTITDVSFGQIYYGQDPNNYINYIYLFVPKPGDPNVGVWMTADLTTM